MNRQFIVGLLAASFAVCSEAWSYSDLESLGMFCPSQDNCQAASNNFTDRSCECDRRCNIYKDCCIDSKRHALNRPQMPYCMPYGREYNLGVYAVNSCPRNYRTSANIRSKCTEEDDITDPLLTAPVTDESVGTTYRNRYCAECNGVSLSSVASWLIYVNCEMLTSYTLNDSYVWENIKYNSASKEWGLILDGDFHKCDIIFDKPDFIPVRFCRANSISTCPESYKRLLVKMACETYMAVVYTSEKSYRNPHCAICNGESIKNLSCEKPLVSTRRGNKHFSFALLLDVNRRDGDVVGKVQKCPAKQVYDPFFKKCRDLVCPLPGSKMVNGKCSRNL
ncbi:uncharacterized protein CEXT_477791 [Caerostris extrusa]|uniref:SMB domain-containing protein n=1 Tax=Caerostris extrusa TaxID=172846 RepID=A0AAV4QVA1_CAEEX|nr:uncharacterized protein CEXT_477791 [Caerostris extrusa]